jgi:hypothetical protein
MAEDFALKGFTKKGLFASNPLPESSYTPFHIILETAIGNGKVLQDLDLESHSTGVDHSQKVKATSVECDYGSRDCVNHRFSWS